MPCRRCGLEPDGHPASQCLNEWVHEQFLGHALSEGNAAGVRTILVRGSNQASARILTTFADTSGRCVVRGQ